MRKSVLKNMACLGFVAAFAATTTSCDNLKKSVIPSQTISWTNASAEIILPATTDTTAQQQLGITQFSYNLDSMIDKQTSGLLGFDDIQSVKIKSIRMTLNNPDASNNFANFSYAGGNFRTNHNNDVYTLGYVPNNPDTYSADLTIPAGDPNKDVKSYFNKNTTFSYAVIAKLRRKTTKELRVKMEVEYLIDLKGN